ncbi:MAG TPA: hypothetical protein VFM00_12495, partial [Candidatus Eisenbacteria bacterium]|nr:hypothetical protein [Candidatus Eisenbacteria bacterium]
MKPWVLRAVALAAVGAAAGIALVRVAPIAEPSSSAAVRADPNLLADSICDCDARAINPDCRTRIIPA